LNNKYRTEGKIKLNCLTYYNKHKKSIREKNRNYSKIKYYSDDLFKYTKLLGSMVRRLFKQKTKTDRSSKILGYTSKQLYEHLSKYFNKPCIDRRACMGTILTSLNSHIDHIIALYNGKSIEERIELCRLDNLRLICNKCNLTKSNKEN
jgi:5-methylcytosine-specific restriction endonuclease McrA